jgi:hypothetical protein
LGLMAQALDLLAQLVELLKKKRNESPRNNL